MATVNGNIQQVTDTGLTKGNFGSSGIKNLGLSESGGVSTGWISGGVLTAVGEAAPDISSGVGYVYVTASDSYTRVVWSAVANLAVTDNAVNYISVNSSGVVSATVTPPTHTDQRTAIQLGRVSMTSGVISGITSTVVSIKQTAPQLYDLFKAIGPVKSGLALTAVGGNLKIAVASGEIYSQGVSGHTNVNNPNEAEFTGNNPQTFRMFTQLASSGGDITDLPVGSYDNAGTVTAIPGAGSQATIFTVYKFSSGNVRTFYGQTIYTNLSAAVQAIGSYVPVVPASFADAIIIGYIAATKNATDLSQATQATFITTNRFGGVGGAVASAGSFMFTDFSNATATLGVLNGGTGTTTSTGTGSVVLSSSPTFTGILNGASSIWSSYILSQAAKTNTINPAALSGNFFGTGGFWGLRSGDDDSFNIDVHNSNSPMNVLKILQTGATSVTGAFTAGGAISGSNLSGTNTGDQNLAPYALLASPALTGTPTAPTATAGTNTTQLATTAFVQTAVGGYLPLTGGTLTGLLAGTTANFNISSGTTLTVLTATGVGVSGTSSGSGTAGLFQASNSAGTSINATGSGAGVISSVNSSSASITAQNSGAGRALEIQNTSSVAVSYFNNAGALTTAAKPTVTGGLYGEFFNGTANTLIFDNGSTAATTEFVIRANGSGGVKLTSGATSWASASDENTKVMTEWKSFVNPLDKIASLRAGSSRYKTDSVNVSRSFLIAQDVQKVLPEAVNVSESGELSLRYTDVIPLLVGALQEEKAKREALEKKFLDLEARIKALELKP